MATGEERAGVWSLMRHPQAGWSRLYTAPMRAGGLVATAAALATIGPIAWLVHDLAFGRGAMGIIQYRPTVPGAVATAVAAWLFSLGAAMLLAAAIDRLAPVFGGTRNSVAALKVAVYGAAPFWLAGVFAVLPQTGWLQLLGLYSLPLIVAGTPVLMHAAGERAGIAGASAGALAFVLAVAALVGAAAVAASVTRPTIKTAHGREVVTGVPGIADARLSAPANTKDQAVAPGTAVAATASPGAAVAASALQSLLPERIGGFSRSAVESQSSVMAGIATADAKGTYVEGANSFTLTIADAGQPGALATSNSVVAGEVNRVTDTGYQRSRLVNGVRVTEKWDGASHGGSYGRTVAGRFTVEAQGTAPSIDVLRGAVAAVDQARLAALAR